MIRFQSYLLFLSIFLFSACKDELSGKDEPKNLIPADTMVLALKDLTLIESHIQMTYLQVSVYKETMKKSGQLVLDKYHLTKDRFEASMDYYGSRQLVMQDIYAKVLDSLNIMSGRIIVDSTELRKQNQLGDTSANLPAFLNVKRKS
jgi:hypothetical protein